MLLWFANKCNGVSVLSFSVPLNPIYGNYTKGSCVYKDQGLGDNKKGALRKRAYKNSDRSYWRLISAQVVVNFPVGSTETTISAISSKKLDWSVESLG